MNELAPLAVAVPLLVAALLMVIHPLLSRTASDVLAGLAALATMVLTLLLLIHVSRGLEVYWFGGWRPRAGVAIGIDFAVDPIGAGLATFVSLLMVLALIYGTRHIEVEHPYFQVLMLTFMAGMVGFCLSGDIFNMFVMFEVMSVSAVALVGYKVRQRAVLEGALNFAVINTIGAFLFLLGIAFLYGHTGALNLAQIGLVLHHSGNDRAVVVAFVLIASALLIKAAVVPFHFWLADAYAVALTPVCILLAGAMSEMGTYGLARIWFTAFQPALGGHTELLRTVFVSVGLLTAVWGAVMALGQDHIKRLLAFVTIAYVGIYMAGFGLLSSEGIAATAVYVVADGFAKALLFACLGIVHDHYGHVGQHQLHGRARGLRGTAFMFFAGGLLLCSLPPFGPFLAQVDARRRGAQSRLLVHARADHAGLGVDCGRGPAGRRPHLPRLGLAQRGAAQRAGCGDRARGRDHGDPHLPADGGAGGGSAPRSGRGGGVVRIRRSGRDRGAPVHRRERLCRGGVRQVTIDRGGLQFVTRVVRLSVRSGSHRAGAGLRRAGSLG